MQDTFMGQIKNPQSLNAYAYAWNNPVNRIDPTGHWVTNSDGTYTAQSGDTLWGLAEQTTGNGSNWTNLGYTGTPENLQVGETIGTSSGNTSSGGTSSGGTSSGGTSSGDTSTGGTSSGNTGSTGTGSTNTGSTGGSTEPSGQHHDHEPTLQPPPEGGSISVPIVKNDTISVGTDNGVNDGAKYLLGTVGSIADAQVGNLVSGVAETVLRGGRTYRCSFICW